VCSNFSWEQALTQLVWAYHKERSRCLVVLLSSWEAGWVVGA